MIRRSALGQVYVLFSQRSLVLLLSQHLLAPRPTCLILRTMGGPKGRRRLEQGFLGAEHFLTPEGKLKVRYRCCRFFSNPEVVGNTRAVCYRFSR